ncbi:MAG: hypothetical protein ACK4UN_07940 [Limisphaerales bacterium]
MSMTTLMSLAAATCLVFGYQAAAQNLSPEDSDGPERILNMLTERERRIVEGQESAADLSREEREHIERVIRLYQLESEGVPHLISEAAGAAASEEIEVRRIDVPEEQFEAIQSEANVNVLMREIATLRAEVMRLNARIDAMEQLGGIAEPVEEEPRFYLPVR